MNDTFTNLDLNQYFLKYQEAKKIFNEYVIGQDYIFNMIMAAVLTGNHILIEGVPGLAKTRSANVIASLLGLDFKRVQFTPDLLPSDLLGNEVFNPKTNEFYIHTGPIFTNLLLIDEINRAPAKLQSALLEAMQEKQVSIGGKTFKLSLPFIVIATQNPIEQEGTFPLSEAQIDRFIIKAVTLYPSREAELNILNLIEKKGESFQINKVFKREDLLILEQLINTNIMVSNLVKEYIIKIVDATRYPENYGLSELKQYIKLGASPRASIAFLKIAKVIAFFNKRKYVIPDDIYSIRYEVLRHRIILSFEAVADSIPVEKIIDSIFKRIPVPDLTHGAISQT